MVPRDLAGKLAQAALSFPAITLTGPRQSGKSTLCRGLFAQHPYVSLEAMDSRRFAQEDPRAFLAELPDGAVIDEVQRAPDLLSFLQAVIDEDPTRSASRWPDAAPSTTCCRSPTTRCCDSLFVAQLTA